MASGAAEGRVLRVVSCVWSGEDAEGLGPWSVGRTVVAGEREPDWWGFGGSSWNSSLLRVSTGGDQEVASDALMLRSL